MYIHLYMTQAHEYAMLGMGECGDEFGKNKDAGKPGACIHFSGHGAYTLADCKLQCDANPKCQGFTASNNNQEDGVTYNWCMLHSAADTARGNGVNDQCYSKGNLKVATALRLLFWNRLC